MGKMQFPDKGCQCPICKDGLGVVMKPLNIKDMPEVVAESIMIYEKTGKHENTLALTALRDAGLIPKDSDFDKLEIDIGKSGWVRVLKPEEIIKKAPGYVAGMFIRDALEKMFRGDLDDQMGMPDMTPEARPNHLTLLH